MKIRKMCTTGCIGLKLDYAWKVTIVTSRLGVADQANEKEEEEGYTEVEEVEVEEEDCDDVFSVGMDVARTELIPPRPGVDTVFEFVTSPKFTGDIYVPAEVIRALVPKTLGIEEIKPLR